MTRRLSWPTGFGWTPSRSRATRPGGAPGDGRPGDGRPGDGRPVRRMTPAAQAVFRGGFEHAVRLGHRHLGSEHLLLALVASDHPAAAVLRAHGLRPDLVEEQLIRLEGGIFGGLDESSLSAIGIDLEAVRERALASFGPEALARAGSAVEADAAARRAGSARWVPGAGRTQPGVRHGGVWDGGQFLPHSPDVGELLRGAQEAGLLEPAAPLDVPQLAVGLLSVAGGMVPQVLTALGVDAAALRAAVAETGEPGGA
jgi:Clp amino terminal domain, pathogenicity island component